MKKKNKKINMVSIALYIVSALFLIYGIYMLIYSINYVKLYDIAYISAWDSIQYIATSCMIYFGFAAVVFALAHLIRILCPPASTPEESLKHDFPPLYELVVEKHEEADEYESSMENRENKEKEPEAISSSMIKDIFEKK